VLLIDDDDAEVFHRSEDGGARAYDDLGFTGEYVAPVLPPLVGFKATVKNGYTLPKTTLKSIKELRGQRYLRYHHER
jgi:hypothetical protein